MEVLLELRFSITHRWP